MSVQRQVWPLQWMPEPPTCSPGRKEPRRRIGSASWLTLLRIVSVSRCVFIMRSCRCTKRSSSRTCGTAKSASVLRMPPRSSATTFKPAAESSLARIPPVQPRPTMTASTSLSLVAMASAHVLDGDRRDGVLLAAVLLDVLVVHRERAGEAEQLPAGLVAVAAMDRVGEEPLDHGLVHRDEEDARGRPALEGDLAALEREEKLLALCGADLVEGLAVALRAVRVGRGDAGAVERRGRDRQLVALVRRSRLPRALLVQALALAPGARESAVDVDGEPYVGALRRVLVGGHHVIDQRLHERRFVGVEVGIGRRARRWGRRGARRRRRLPQLRLCRARERRRCRGGARHRAFQERAAALGFFLHGLSSPRVTDTPAG